MQGRTILSLVPNASPRGTCGTCGTRDTLINVTSYLVISKNKSLLQKEVEKICEQFSVHSLDRVTINKPDDAKIDKTRKTTKSIGIDDIKKMRQQIFLKPYKSLTKAVIFEDGELLTPEAQNALLKVMEEPPEHTIILITARSKDAILPTIQSRSHIIELQDTSVPTESERSQSALFLEAIKNMNIQQALELAEQYEKMKDALPESLERSIIALRNNMLQEEKGEEIIKLAGTMKTLQKAHKVITTTNANQRLTLETAFLSLSE